MEVSNNRPAGSAPPARGNNTGNPVAASDGSVYGSAGAARLNLADLPPEMLNHIRQQGLDPRDALALAQTSRAAREGYFDEDLAFLVDFVKFEKRCLDILHYYKFVDGTQKDALLNAYQEVLAKLFDPQSGRKGEWSSLIGLARAFYEYLLAPDISEQLDRILPHISWHNQLERIVQSDLELGASLFSLGQMRQYNVDDGCLLSRFPMGPEQVRSFLDGVRLSGSDSAIHYAAKCGNPVVIAAFLAANQECIDQLNLLGETPLALAVSERQIDVVSLLLQAGANVDVYDKLGGDTPLLNIARSWIARDERAGYIADLLVAGRADVNARDSYGNTALMMASMRGNRELVNLLLTYHPDDLDINAVNVYEQNAVSLAAQAGHQDIVQLLVSYTQGQHFSS